MAEEVELKATFSHISGVNPREYGYNEHTNDFLGEDFRCQVKNSDEKIMNTMMPLSYYVAQEQRAIELGLPVPGTRKRRRHNYERREFRGISHRSGHRVREMRAAMITE